MLLGSALRPPLWAYNQLSFTKRRQPKKQQLVRPCGWGLDLVESEPFNKTDRFMPIPQGLRYLDEIEWHGRIASRIFSLAGDNGTKVERRKKSWLFAYGEN